MVIVTDRLQNKKRPREEKLITQAGIGYLTQISGSSRCEIWI
jgi:hypothetical protein